MVALVLRGGEGLLVSGAWTTNEECCCVPPCECSCPYLTDLWDALATLDWSSNDICGGSANGTIPAADALDGCIAWEGEVLSGTESPLTLTLWCDDTGVHIDWVSLGENCEVLDLVIDSVDCQADSITIVLSGTVTEIPGIPAPGACVCDGTPFTLTLSG